MDLKNTVLPIVGAPLFVALLAFWFLDGWGAVARGGLLLLAGGVAFVLAWREYRKRRAILDTPTSKVRSMAVGAVELKGEAQPAPGASLVEGPFSQEKCIGYACKVEEKRTRTVRTKSGTRRQTYWATVYSTANRAPIGLRDETGIALVDPDGGDYPFSDKTGFGQGFGRDPPDHVRTFIESQGVDTTGLFGLNKTMRYVEERLTPGARLYVLGTAVRAREHENAAQAAGNAALVVQKEGRVPFILSTKQEKALASGYSGSFFWAVSGSISAITFGLYLLSTSF